MSSVIINMFLLIIPLYLPDLDTFSTSGPSHCDLFFRQPLSIIALLLSCILLSQTSKASEQELSRPHQFDVDLFSRFVIGFAQLFHLAVSLSLTGEQSRHLIKREAADRLRYENAGGAELWVPVAFLTVERDCCDPVTVNTTCELSDSHSKPHWNVSSS